MRAKFTSHINLNPLDIVKNRSYVTKNILSNKEAIKKAAIWRIGSRETTDLWKDPWIMVNNEPTPLGKVINIRDTRTKVKEVLSGNLT